MQLSGICLRQNFILELVDHHQQREQLSPAPPKGALAAARTLGHARSPSSQAPLDPAIQPHFLMVRLCLIRSHRGPVEAFTGLALDLASGLPLAVPRC